MFERFTDRARRVIVLAQEEARTLQHNYIGTEHLLLGLIREEEGIAHRVLSEFGVTDEMVCSVLQRSVGKGVSGAAPSQGLTPRAKGVVELAGSEAARMGSPMLGPAPLRMGLLREGGNMALRILRTVGVDPKKMYSSIVQKLIDELNIDCRIRSVPYPMLDMIARSMERLGRKSAKEPPLTHYGVSKLNFDFTLDITRAQEELGYQPVLTLDEGIEKTAAWLRDHGKLPR